MSSVQNNGRSTGGITGKGFRPGRSGGPVLLGSAAWINDDALIAKLKELSGACIVVTKQGRKPVCRASRR